MRSFNILEVQTANKYFKEIIMKISSSLSNGNPLSLALASFPYIFPPYMVGAIKAGEKGGKLPQILNRLAKCEEEREALTRKIKTFLNYPIIVLLLSVLFLFFVGKILFDRISPLYAATKQLPLLTKLLIFTFNAINSPWIWLLFILIITGIFSCIKEWLKIPGSKLKLDTFLLRFPLIGKLLLKENIITFLFAFESLLSSGVPLFNAIEFASKAVPNTAFGGIARYVKEDLMKGISLHKSFSRSSYIPKIFLEFVKTGETTGNLPKFLKLLEKYYEEDIKYTIAMYEALLEPLLIFFVGIIVTVLVLGILGPILNVIKELSA